ncbi:MAG: hypothetical protein U0271_18970 [Polyangiaceae bacterium]
MMLPTLRKLRRPLAIALLIVAAGCTSAYRKAMDRGDSFARSGRWDEAAAAYEEATNLEPEEQEARLALREARRQQSVMRTKLGYDLLAQGRPRDALDPFKDAIRFDPMNTRAQSGLAEAKREVLALARSSLAQGQNRQAYELAHAVVAIDPTSTEALDVESQAKHAIYVAAIARAEGLEGMNQRALALVDYGEALEFEPWQTDATTRATGIRNALREEVTYIVAVKNFDGDKATDDLGNDVNASVLAQGVDPTLPIRFVDRMPKAAAYTIQGMRLGGVFRNYTFQKQSTKTQRSCDYICGTELVPNPNYATAEAAMRTSQQVLGAAEGRLASARTAVAPAERDRDAAQQTRNAAQTELDRAEQELSRCRSSGGNPPPTCDAEQQRRDRAAQDLANADSALAIAENSLNQARRELSDAQSDRDRRASEADSARRTFESTPPKVAVDKHCLYTYEVETVTVTGDVECMLRGEGLYDTTPLLTQSVAGHATHQDETFPAHAGVCAEVAAGDPLQLPSEGQVKKELVGTAVTGARRELLATFEAYRREYLHQADVANSDGRPNDAATNQVKFLLTLSFDERKTQAMPSVNALSAMRGVDVFGVQIGVFGETLKP